MRLNPDPWLTELFGHPVYRATDIPASSEEQPPGWLARAVGGGDAFLFARVAADNVRRVQALCAEGFQVVDLALQLSRSVSPAPSAESTRRLEIRRAAPADYERIRKIAGSAFKYSRFHLDPLVPRSLAHRIKQAWMESYCAGRRGIGCLVAVEGAAVLGFLAMIEIRRQQAVRVIDLMAVDSSAQGRGIGRALVEGFVESAVGRTDEVEVGTQAANVPSVRLYESCGFRLAETAYVLHAHFRDGVPLRC